MEYDAFDEAMMDTRKNKAQMEWKLADKNNWINNMYICNDTRADEIYYIDGTELTPHSHYKLSRAGKNVKITIEKDGKEKEIDVYTWWCAHKNRKSIDKARFSPEKKETIYYDDDGNICLNTYRPHYMTLKYDMNDEEIAEHARLFVSHIHNLVENDEEAAVIMDFLAFLLQRPEERPSFAVMITSNTEGVGKDTITNIFKDIFGSGYTSSTSMDEVASNTSWGDVFYRKKLIVVSEGDKVKDKYKIGNAMKEVITSYKKQMNLKGSKSIEENMYAGIMVFCNDSDPFKIHEGDRRFFCTTCDWSQDKKEEMEKSGYFKQIYDYYRHNDRHLYGLAMFFMNREITTNMHGDAPMTETKRIILNNNKDEVEQFFSVLAKHPLKFWTKSKALELFECGRRGIHSNDIILQKRFEHYWKNKMYAVKTLVIKIDGVSYRFKACDTTLARSSNDKIRENWIAFSNNAHIYFDDESLIDNESVIMMADA